MISGGVINRMSTSIPFEGDERERYETYVKATGRSTTAYLRSLVMREVENWENSLKGNDQAAALREQMREQA